MEALSKEAPNVLEKQLAQNRTHNRIDKLKRGKQEK